MNLYEYTASGNPSGARQVVSSYGIHPSHDPLELSRQLGFCVAKGRQEALDRVASVHPDYKLIEQKVKASIVPEKKEHSNACGCGGSCGSGFSNANGQEMKADVKSRIEKPSVTEMWATGGLILLGLAIVLKSSK